MRRDRCDCRMVKVGQLNEETATRTFPGLCKIVRSGLLQYLFQSSLEIGVELETHAYLHETTAISMPWGDNCCRLGKSFNVVTVLRRKPMVNGA
jgi:hypothetical protein